ncbi:MAG: D-Ala-D-Ala carboxypeptidase family metallohydrolase [Clostridia bacterium]|nr:D-Ala-D-Ala carboxypeptidase family metallohydrolase [Clostridia bacterium]
MTVKVYYVSKSGEEKLSTNFKVKEFQCHDKTDKVLIDTNLVSLLQSVRTHFGKPVIITSAYRTSEYNASIGGSSKSNHVKGMAADIQIAGISPVIVGMYLESLNAGGIGLYAYGAYTGFNHVDTRSIKYRWLTITRNGSYQAISKILPTIKQGVTSANPTYVVKLLQRTLGVTESGTFGGITTNAVKQFQRYAGLKDDGIVGKNTWTKMFS